LQFQATWNNIHIVQGQDSNEGANQMSAITDEEIGKLFEQSWATHGDRVLRFARMIELRIKLNGIDISHDDACALSQIFNAHSNTLQPDQQTRINEWLKEVIISALMADVRKGKEASALSGDSAHTDHGPASLT
jgi:hypothetical protein